MLRDLLAVLAVTTVLGLAAGPIARAVLAPLHAGAAGLARPLGILLAAIPLWICASLNLVPYTTATAWLGVAGLALAGLAVFERARRRGEPRTWRPGPASIGAEVVFLVCFGVAAVVVAHAPDVWGTERPMDMAILGATEQARHFPPADPWLSGEQLNYYYLGQYLMGFVVRLAGTGPTEGYNLAVALVWALGAAAAFAVGAAAARALTRDERGALLGGTLATLLTVVGSNVEGLRLLLAREDTLDWFSAGRVVPGAINDFPALELVVGDLHAHVVAVPFTLLALAFVLQALLHEPRAGAGAVVAGTVVGVLGPINTWSYPVCLGLLLAAGALGRGRCGASARGRRSSPASACSCTCRSTRRSIPAACAGWRARRSAGSSPTSPATSCACTALRSFRCSWRLPPRSCRRCHGGRALPPRPQPRSPPSSSSWRATSAARSSCSSRSAGRSRYCCTAARGRGASRSCCLRAASCAFSSPSSCSSATPSRARPSTG